MKSNSTISTYLRFFLKVGIGGFLIYYVLRGKMVDFRALEEVLFDPLNLFVGVSVLAFNAVVCGTRWFYLVRAQGLALSYNRVLQLTMIGVFFNTFMPGAVGGDVIKAWYVARQESQRKTRAIFTVLLDRVIGLSVIVGYAAVTLLFFTHWLFQRKELQAVGISIWGFTVGAILFNAFFFGTANRKSKKGDAFLQIFYKFRPLGKVIDALLLYRHQFPAILIAIGLSSLNVLGATFLFYYLGNVLGIQMPLAHYFFVIPLGMTASAIPLLPGGIGVGQVAFYTIFLWIGMPNPEQGGTLCTLFQIYMLLFNCTGALFYLRFKNKPTALDIQEATEDPQDRPVDVSQVAKEHQPQEAGT